MAVSEETCRRKNSWMEEMSNGNEEECNECKSDGIFGRTCTDIGGLTDYFFRIGQPWYFKCAGCSRVDTLSDCSRICCDLYEA